jgi:two-component system, chemotaxis family, chemotaxis protein CheY
MGSIVIVGGTEEAQLILRGLLRLHQHRIVGTSLLGPPALEMLRQTPEPVLLVDVELKEPAWTDYVPQALKANPKTRVVLLTPSRSARLDTQARALGVEALVRRPFAIQELLTAVGPASPPPSPPTPSAPSPPPPPETG